VASSGDPAGTKAWVFRRPHLWPEVAGAGAQPPAPRRLSPSVPDGPFCVLGRRAGLRKPAGIYRYTLPPAVYSGTGDSNFSCGAWRARSTAGGGVHDRGIEAVHHPEAIPLQL